MKEIKGTHKQIKYASSVRSSTFEKYSKYQKEVKCKYFANQDNREIDIFFSFIDMYMSNIDDHQFWIDINIKKKSIKQVVDMIVLMDPALQVIKNNIDYTIDCKKPFVAIY